jgi:hypothetical protein
MRIFKIVAAIALSAAFVSPLPASAGQFSPSSPLVESPVIQVSGCHRDIQRHFVPEFGRRAWHFHRRPSCRPVRVDGPDGDIEDMPRPRPPMDCHRDARRHFLPEFGRAMMHRHVGPDCRVRILRQSDVFRPGACVTVGPITFCD